jgi:hypothetical protein
VKAKIAYKSLSEILSSNVVTLVSMSGMLIMLNVRSEFFTAVTVKNVVFWDATQCGSCKNLPHGIQSQKTLYFLLLLISHLIFDMSPPRF